MLKMVDGTGIIGVDMICPLGVSTPQPPNYDRVEMEGTGMLVLPNSLNAPLERLELGGKTEQVQTSGKNLANPSEFVIGTLAGDTGNIIALKQYITTGYIPVIPGKMYSTRCGNKFLTHTITAYDKEKIKINYPMNMSSEMPEGAAYIRLSYKKIDMTNVTESDMEELKKVCMVNEGSTVLPYEPYTGGKPSPSPEYQQEIKSAGKWNEEKQKYEIDVKVTGKNLFNAEKARDIANWIVRDGDGYAKFPIRAGKGNTITFSYSENLTAGKGFYIGITQSETSSIASWLYHSADISVSKNKYTAVAAGEYIYLSCIKSGIQNFLDTIQTLQVEISASQTPYEPYTEQPLTITSDRPITKWDKLVEQGGQYGGLHGGDIKTFENDVFKLYADNEKAIQYQVPFEEITNSWNELVCYCNTFENVIGQTIYTQSGKTDFYMGCVHKSMVFSAKNKQGIFQSIEAFQEWIRNSDTYVWYKTDNKKFVPLPQSEQTQLRNLHSENGTTHINIDSGEVLCGIKLTYRKEK